MCTIALFLVSRLINYFAQYLKMRLASSSQHTWPRKLLGTRLRTSFGRSNLHWQQANRHDRINGECYILPAGGAMSESIFNVIIR